MKCIRRQRNRTWCGVDDLRAVALVYAEGEIHRDAHGSTDADAICRTCLDRAHEARAVLYTHAHRRVLEWS